MSERIEARCSSLPRLWECQGERFIDAPEIRSKGDDTASTGSAAHEYMAQFVADETQLPSLEEIASRWGADLDELEYLTAMGKKAWATLKDYVDDDMPMTEHAMSACMNNTIMLTGHLDVSAVDEARRRGLVVDWFTGYLDANKEQQMRGYAYMEVISHDIDEVVAAVVHCRLQTIQTWVWSKKELVDWWEALCDKLQHADGAQFQTGKHCTYCPKFLSCPAQMQVVRFAANALAEVDAKMAVMSSGEKVELYQAMQTIDKRMKAAKDILRAELDATGEPITGDGWELALKESEKTTIDAASGWAILAEAVGGAENMASCVKVGKGAVETAIRARTDKGKKAAVDFVMEQLDAVGALTTKTTRSLALKKTEA